MRRAAAVVRWAGLIAVLFSLLAPLNAAWTAAEAIQPKPDTALAQDAATPNVPPDIEPVETVEPTVGPHLSSPADEPSSPTVEPTAAAVPAKKPKPQGENARETMLVQSQDVVPFAMSANQTTVHAGSPIVITFTISGVAEAALEGTFPTGNGLNWSLDPGTQGCSLSNGSLYCELYHLQGAPTEVKVASQTTNAACGTHTVTGYLTSITDMPDYQSTTFTVSCLPPTPQPEISISGPTTARPGDSLDYTIVLSNSGNAPLTSGSNMYVSAPSAMGTWSMIDQAAGAPATDCTLANHDEYECSARSLAPGASVTYTLRIQNLTDGTCGTVLVQAYVTDHSNPDPSYEAVDSVNLTVDCPPSLSISITGPEHIMPGDDVVYKVMVTNTGGGTATSVTFSGTMPNTGVDWGITSNSEGGTCSVTPDGELTCTISVLQPRSGAFDVQVASSTSSQSSLCDGLTATASLTGVYSGTDSFRTGVACESDLAVEVTGMESAEPTTALSYTITITNSGTTTADNISFTVWLPPRFDGVWEVRETLGAKFINCLQDMASLQCGSISLDSGGTSSYILLLKNDSHRACGAFDVRVSLSTGQNDATATRILCNPELQLTNLIVAVDDTDGTRREVQPGEAVEGLRAGDQVTYRLVATNTGTGLLTSVTIENPGATITGCDQPTPVSILAPDAMLTCHTSHTITEADILAGSFTNTATVDSDQTEPTSASVSVTTVNPAPSLGLTKAVISVDDTPVGEFDGDIVLGTEITYQLVATNTGNISISDVSMNEQSGVSLGACEPVRLIPGGTLRCDATYTITQEDIDRGRFANTATATGLAANQADVSAMANTTVNVDQAPALGLSASGGYVDPTDVAPLGTVSYALSASNTGTVTLTGVTLTTDPAGMALACTVGGVPTGLPTTLSPGASLGCTTSHPVSQTEMDAGSLTVRVQADSDQTEAAEESVAVTLPWNPAVSLEVTATNIPTSGYGVGDIVTYDISVRNAGNVSLTGLTVTNDVPSLQVDCGIPDADIENTVSSLPPGGTFTCTATYTISQADVETGEFTSTTTVTGDTPAGANPATVSDNEEKTVPTNSTPAITLQKTYGEQDQLAGGSTVTYTLIATNSGNVRLDNVAIVDSMPGLTNLSCTIDGEDAEQPVSLPRDSEIICTTTYAVTQNDVDRGQVTNEAQVNGRYGETEVSDTASVTLGDPATRAARVEIMTTANPQNGVSAGTDVSLTYSIRNTGNVTLTNLVVTDDTVTGIDCGDGTNVIGKLAPVDGAIDCIATFKVTQAFIDAYEPADGEAGWLLTTATTVIANTPSGMDPAQVIDDATVTVSGVRQVSIGLHTSVTQIDGEDIPASEPVTGLGAGQEVTYTLTATNSGNVTLDEVLIASSLLGSLTCDSTAPVTLAPGASVSCTGTLTITQEMFEADTDRQLTNGVTVAAIDPQGNPAGGSSGDTISLEAATPALQMDASITPPAVTAPQRVSLTQTLKNTGNVSLQNISLPGNDLFESHAITCEGDLAALPVGASITCTVSFMITQDHLDSGQRHLTLPSRASAQSTLAPQVFSDEATASVELQQVADVDATLTIEGASTGLDLGDTAAFQIAVTNTGNVTLGNLTLDTRDASLEVTCPAGTIAPGGTVECMLQHALTEQDIISGGYDVNATVRVTTPHGSTLQQELSAGITTVAPTSSLSVTVQAVSADELGTPLEQASLGDAITYRFEIRNTGNMTIAGIELQSDALASAGMDIPAAGNLAPGEATTVTATYTVAASDVERGTITNEAIAAGTDTTGHTVTSPAKSVTVPVVQHPALAVTTEVSEPEDGAHQGSLIEFIFTVSNTGDVTLRDVEFTTTLPGLVWTGDDSAPANQVSTAQTSTGAAIGDLAPGEAETIQAAYTIANADSVAGVVRATIAVTAIGPGGDLVSSTSDEVVIDIEQTAPSPTPEITPTGTPEPTATPGTTPTLETPAPSSPTAGMPSTPEKPGTSPSRDATTPEVTSGASDTPVVTTLPSTGSGGPDTVFGAWIALAAITAVLIASAGIRFHTRQR